jgi:hypothetical protein
MFAPRPDEDLGFLAEFKSSQEPLMDEDEPVEEFLDSVIEDVELIDEDSADPVDDGTIEFEVEDLVEEDEEITQRRQRRRNRRRGQNDEADDAGDDAGDVAAAAPSRSRAKSERGKRSGGSPRKKPSPKDEVDENLEPEDSQFAAGLNTEEEREPKKSDSRRRAAKTKRSRVKDVGSSRGSENLEREEPEESDVSEERTRGERKKKAKKIPTWSEAVDCIVDRNLASRKKNSGPRRRRSR